MPSQQPSSALLLMGHGTWTRCNALCVSICFSILSLSAAGTSFASTASKRQDARWDHARTSDTFILLAFIAPSQVLDANKSRPNYPGSRGEAKCPGPCCTIVYAHQASSHPLLHHTCTACRSTFFVDAATVSKFIFELRNQKTFSAFLHLYLPLVFGAGCNKRLRTLIMMLYPKETARRAREVAEDRGVAE